MTDEHTLGRRLELAKRFSIRQRSRQASCRVPGYPCISTSRQSTREIPNLVIAGKTGSRRASASSRILRIPVGKLRQSAECLAAQRFVPDVTFSGRGTGKGGGCSETPLPRLSRRQPDAAIGTEAGPVISSRIDETSTQQMTVRLFYPARR